MHKLSKDQLKERELLLEKLGVHIHIIRVKRRMLQKDVAELSGFSRSNYNLIEKGKRNLTFFSMYRIAKALDVPMDRLLKFKEVDEI